MTNVPEMDHFLLRRGESLVWDASPRFRPTSAGAVTLFLEGAVFRARPGGPHVGREGARAVLERILDRGVEALADVIGDFVACVATERGVFAFKSFTSQYQLYVREDRVSNRLAALVTEDEIELDAEYFARHVLMVAGVQFHTAATPLRGVTRVLPGELVQLGTRSECAERRQLVHRRYSYVLDKAQRKEDVAPELLRVLRECVTDRLDAAPDAPVCVELSGGLDSSFIACLVGAARKNVHAVMFSRPDVPSHRVSETYAKGVAERYGLDLTILSPDELPRAETAEVVRYGDEPSDFFWFGDLFSRAVADLAAPDSLVFTGFGADQLFLRSPSFLPYLLARRQLREFARTLGPVSTLLSRSPLQLAAQSALSQLPRGLYFKLAAPFQGRRFDPLAVADVNIHRTLYEPVPWVSAGVQQETFDLERQAAERRLVGDGIICDDWGYFAAPRAVTAPHFESSRLVDASPYCDLRLIDFVYERVSAYLVHDFEGRYKELLREAQRGIVPEDLRARKNDMFVFNSFLGEYFTRHKERLLALLEDVPRGWIDANGARRAFEELGFGIMSSSTRSLIALLGYLVWRRAFVAAVRARATAAPTLT